MIIDYLKNHPHIIPQIAKIYIDEWGWHYSDEWNVHTLEEMIEDIRSNYLDCTLIGFQDDNFIGTVAVLDADLKTHSHLTPWITCLYVMPESRNKGYGRALLEEALNSSPRPVYVWCYTEKEKEMYTRWGFEVIDEILYKYRVTGYVLCYS